MYTNYTMLNGRRGILFGLASVCVLSIGFALPCLTTGSKKDFDKTRTALKSLESLLNRTIKNLDKDLIEMEGDFKRRQWRKYNDHCYFFGTESVQWTTAERQCREIGGYLAKIDDANENAWIYEKMKKAKAGHYFWVGMTDVANTDWRWIYDQSKPKYKKWHSGRPYSVSSSYSKDYNCVVIHPNTGTWFDFPCNSKYSYVCESNFCFA